MHAPYAQFDPASGKLLRHTAYANARYWPDEQRLLAIEARHTRPVPSAQGRQ